MINHPNRSTKRDRLCDYGNCHNTDVAVTVNVFGDPAQRPAFCSTRHAAIWLAMQSVPMSPTREAHRTALEALIGGA